MLTRLGMRLSATFSRAQQSTRQLSSAAQQAPTSQTHIQQTLGKHKPVPALQPTRFAVIGNRGVCAKKIGEDLERHRVDTFYLYTKGDITTPVIQQALRQQRAFEVKNYTDIPSIQAAADNIKKIVRANSSGSIEGTFQPGWGLGSEDADFADAINSIPDLIFAGPRGDVMRMVGPKNASRNLVAEVEKNTNMGLDLNPQYIEVPNFPLSDINTHNSQLVAIYEKVMTMKDVYIKANNGGGGRGNLRFITANKSLSDFLTAIRNIKERSQLLFNDASIMIEQTIPAGYHLEFQLLMGDKKSALVGVRKCTAQSNDQKLLELSLCPKDFPPDFIKSLQRFCRALGEKMAILGYTGAATVEFMVYKEHGKYHAKFLEINARIQVEHPVTEYTMMLAAGHPLQKGPTFSIPYITDILARSGNPVTFLAKHYNITDPSYFDPLSEERIGHWRICGLEMNAEEKIKRPGKHAKNAEAVLGKLQPTATTRTILGGIGDGTFDPMYATTWGPIQAARLNVEKFVQSRTQFNEEHIDNCEFLLNTVHPRLFLPSGAVNPEITTKTFHTMLTEGTPASQLRVQEERHNIQYLFFGEGIAVDVDSVLQTFPHKVPRAG